MARIPDTLCLFDVDGTLTLPRKKIEPHMSEFMLKMKEKVTCGLVGGSDLNKIAEQMGGMEALMKFDYVFAENGLVAYKNGQFLKKESIQNHMGEEKLQTFMVVSAETVVKFESNLDKVRKNQEQKINYRAQISMHDQRQSSIQAIELESQA